MSYKNNLHNVVSYIPTVQQPKQHVSFKNKILWTLGILMLYFIMTNIPIYGAEEGQDLLGELRGVLAAEQGSLMQLGIMPIVTASIMLQIMSGTNMLPLDMSNPRDKSLYQGLKRLLIFIMVILNSIPIVFAGEFLIPSTATAADLGITTDTLKFIIFAQVVFGGLLIYYMHEVITKWGIGSGIGIFIIAGVSQRFVGGLFEEVLGGWWAIATGSVPLDFSTGTAEMLLFGSGNILPILTTVIIFSIIVYAESTRVEIPVSNIKVKQKGRFPIKLIYASVLPIILIRAFQANIQFMGQTLDSQLGGAMPSWLGQYTGDGEPIGGLFYYLNPIYAPEDWMWWLGTTSAEVHQILLRVFVDFTFMAVGGALFALFWVKTTGMDSQATAQKIYHSGLEIPSFRRHPDRIERVLERYIPFITIVGGALIGALAVTANMLGTIGGVTGTGLLLAVSITYKLYEEIAEEQLSKWI